MKAGNFPQESSGRNHIETSRDAWLRGNLSRNLSIQTARYVAILLRWISGPGHHCQDAKTESGRLLSLLCKSLDLVMIHWTQPAESISPVRRHEF